MKIRLHITHTSGHSAIFEHTGPNVRLGRDPAGELTLEGDSSQGVSWNHARIELTPAGAFLSDLGSTNGTLLNGQRISTRSAIRLGDHLQLGHTGPKLKIVDLELSPGLGEKVSAPPRAGAPTIPSVEATAPILAAGQPGMTGVLRTMQRTQRTLLMGLMLLGACVLLLAVALWWKAGPSKKQPEAPVEETATTVDSRVARASQGAPVGDAAKSVPTLVATPANVPNGEHKEVGRYVLRDKEPPSVLLQRERDPDPWGRLRPDSPIRTGYHLVSLPGYRSKLYLQSGVHLVLWGNVPEFSAFPPVLESMVMLHEASPGIDLEFTLERGRVHLSNYKSKGPATVRIRFHQELWDLVLPDNTSEAALELWGLYDPESPISKEAGEKAPVACVGLFIKGGALLETKTRAYHLPDLSQFEW